MKTMGLGVIAVSFVVMMQGCLPHSRRASRLQLPLRRDTRRLSMRKRRSMI